MVSRMATTCNHCNKPVMELTHIFTGSKLILDIEPKKDGWILVNQDEGTCRVIPVKFRKGYQKNKENRLYEAHINTCPSQKAGGSW